MSESAEREATTNVDQIARQSSSASQSDSVSAKEAEVETLTGLSAELEKKASITRLVLINVLVLII